MQGQAVPQGGVLGQAPELAHAALAPSLLLRPWIQSYISRVNIPNKEAYCLRQEVPVVGRLIHLLPFWEEVIQADHWGQVVICHRYAIELFPTLVKYRGSGMLKLHPLDHTPGLKRLFCQFKHNIHHI